MAVTATIAFVLTAGVFLYRASRVAGIPDLGDPFDVATFAAETIPPEENAFEDYRAAESLMGPGSNFQGISNDYQHAIDHGWNEATDGVKDWLEANRPALDRWLQGTRKPHYMAPWHGDAAHPESRVLLPLRWLVRLAQLEASRLESAGEREATWKMLHAILRCSRHHQQHDNSMSRFAGAGDHARFCFQAERWSRSPDVTAEQLASALDAVRAEFARTVPLSVAIKHNYCETVAMMDAKEFGRPAPARSKLEAVEAGCRRILAFVQNEPQRCRLTVRQAYAHILDHVDKPSAAPLLRFTFHDSDLVLFDDSAAPPSDPRRLRTPALAAALEASPLATNVTRLASFDLLISNRDRELARQRMLVVALALQIHRRQTGGFPDDLNALVSAKILDEIPVDPLSRAGDRLRYRQTDGAVVVYSVGENGRDDDGDVEREPDRGQPTDSGFRIPIE